MRSQRGPLPRLRLSVRPGPKPRPAGPRRNPPPGWRGVARARLPSWAIFHSAPQAGGGLCPTPPGRRRNGKAHSAQHGSRRLHLFVRRRGRLRPSTGPRAAPAPSPRGLGDRHAQAVAHGSPQPGAGSQGRRRLGSVSSGLRKCRGVRVMLSGYPEAGGSDTGDPEADNSENLPTQPEDKDPVGCRHTPRL